MDREAVGSVAEMKDAAETEGARRATGVSADAGRTPDPEVVAKAKRRRFSAEYRLKILRQERVHEILGIPLRTLADEGDD